MSRYLKIVFYLKTTLRCNAVTYYLQGIPFLRKYLSKTMTATMFWKKVMAVSSTVFYIVFLSTIKILCLFLFAVFIPIWISQKTGSKITDYRPYYLQAVFFLFCVLGSFQESRIFLLTKTKHICFINMKMPIKEGLLAFLTVEYAIQFISIFFVFLTGTMFLLQDRKALLVLTVAYVCLQISSEGIHLKAFERTLIPLERNKAFSALLLVISLMGAYGPLVFEGLLIEKIVMNPVFFLFLLTCGSAALYYIAFGSSGYTEELRRIFQTSSLEDEIRERKNQKRLDKDSDVLIDLPQNIEKKKGFVFLNSVFVLRNKRSVISYLKRRFVFLMGIILLTVFYLSYDHSSALNIMGKIYMFSPILPVVVCYYAYGEGFSKLCYTNCDSKLLPYGFYRTRKAILENYLIRLFYVLKYNLCLAVGTSFAFFLLYGIVGVDFNIEIGMFLGTLNLLIFGFGVHHLSMYYLLQPYVQNSVIQNPVLFVVQCPMLALSYVLIFLNLAPVDLMRLLFIICIIYIFALVLLVLVKAPASFRLK